MPEKVKTKETKKVISRKTREKKKVLCQLCAISTEEGWQNYQK